MRDEISCSKIQPLIKKVTIENFSNFVGREERGNKTHVNVLEQIIYTLEV